MPGKRHNMGPVRLGTYRAATTAAIVAIYVFG